MAAALPISRPSGLRLALLLILLAATLLLLLLLLFYAQYRQSSQKRTVVMTLKGRLGNQLFQVAAGEYFRRAASSEGTSADLVFKRNAYSEETDFSKGIFQELPHFDTEADACSAVRKRSRVMLKETRYSCELMAARRVRNDCTIVDGFFQCPEYAQAGRGKVMQLVRAADEYKTAENKLRALTSEAKGEIVAVHVRRGDYTKRFNRGLLEPVDVEYYARAAEKMPAGATFLIFSDDLEWCRTELGPMLARGGVDEQNIIFVDETNGLSSLIMMTLAHHNIIANSTFSWWAAFLNENKNKIVCAPRKWFGKRVREKVHIYPKGWILL